MLPCQQGLPVTPPLLLLNCLSGSCRYAGKLFPSQTAVASWAQFPALLLISLHTTEVFWQVAPVDLTVPKMGILAYVSMWAAMLVMTLLENKYAGVLLSVSSSMQISVVRLVLCAGTVVREPTVSR